MRQSHLTRCLLTGAQAGLVGEVMLPAGIGEAEVDRIGHGGVEDGGDALEAC